MGKGPCKWLVDEEQLKTWGREGMSVPDAEKMLQGLAVRYQREPSREEVKELCRMCAECVKDAGKHRSFTDHAAFLGSEDKLLNLAIHPTIVARALISYRKPAQSDRKMNRQRAEPGDKTGACAKLLFRWLVHKHLFIHH